MNRLGRTVLVLLLLLLMWAVVYGQQPPGPPPDPFCGTPPPGLPPSCVPAAPEPMHPSCTDHCITRVLRYTRAPRSFTAEDFGQPLDTLGDHVWCEGQLATAGTLRYFTDGSAPSATVGILVPWAPPQPADPAQTLEDGHVVVLYNRSLVLGFKAVAATGAFVEMAWTCQL